MLNDSLDASSWMRPLLLTRSGSQNNGVVSRYLNALGDASTVQVDLSGAGVDTFERLLVSCAMTYLSYVEIPLKEKDSSSPVDLWAVLRIADVYRSLPALSHRQW